MSPAVYRIEVQQVSNIDTANAATGVLAGLNLLYDYTVDFKVDGETVPELSGEMKTFETIFSPTVTTSEIRSFWFTNNVYPDGATPGATNEVFVPGAPQDTQLNPAKGGNFLEFVLDNDGGDTYQITPLEEPLSITGVSGPCGTVPNVALTSDMPFSCAYYADNVAGAFEYRFFFSATSNGMTGNEQLDAFDVDIASNGVVIPGGPEVPPMSGRTALFTTFLIRADSGDGPVIVTEETPPVVIEITFTAAAGATVMLADASVAAAVCAKSNDIGTLAAPLTATVILSCREYFAGSHEFTFTAAATDVTYTTYYLGSVVPALSGTVANVGTSIHILFSTPVTPGDALTITSGVTIT